jgi:geranylgeranyl diphosphate synthase type I
MNSNPIAMDRGRGPEHDEALLAQLSAECERRWPLTAQALHAIHRYAMLPPGKLLRPLLVLESALAVGGDAERVFPAAIGFECAHVASLIHDDIIDHDDIRRGCASVRHYFGLERAILAGDSLFFQWFDALGECLARGVPAEQVAAAMRIQAVTGMELCRGVELELSLGGDIRCGVDRYLEVARLKTAVLLSSACRIGAVLGGTGREPERARTLGEFGEALGLAFQIRDDLLPYDSCPGTIGKPAGSDLRNRRPTLPLLLAYQAGTRDDRALIEHALSTDADCASAHTPVLHVIHRTGAYAASLRIAAEHAGRAYRLLAALPATSSRERLRQLAQTAVSRKE